MSLFLFLFRLDSTWQVPTLCFLFFLLGIGNIITTSWTIPSKIREANLGLLQMRFTRLDKYFWNHSQSMFKVIFIKITLCEKIDKKCLIIFKPLC